MSQSTSSGVARRYPIGIQTFSEVRSGGYVCVDKSAYLQDFREVMREFYAPLKAADEYLRFVFLTGITKFSQLSIFSELNSLKNISLDHRFAGICGITQEEVETQLAPDVLTLANRMGVSYAHALPGRLPHGSWLVM